MDYVIGETPNDMKMDLEKPDYQWSMLCKRTVLIILSEITKHGPVAAWALGLRKIEVLSTKRKMLTANIFEFPHFLLRKSKALYAKVYPHICGKTE